MECADHLHETLISTSEIKQAAIAHMQRLNACIRARTVAQVTFSLFTDVPLAYFFGFEGSAWGETETRGTMATTTKVKRIMTQPIVRYSHVPPSDGVVVLFS